MYVPFGKELDEVFRGDRSIWLKVLGCGFVSCAFAVYMLVRFEIRAAGEGIAGSQFSIWTLILLGLLSAFGGCVLGVMLSLKDVVTRRVQDGRPVSRVLRLYFASRIKSLAIWVVTLHVVVAVVAFVVTMATL